MPTYETEIIIDAPPAEVWRHLIDVAQHDEWSQHFWLRGEPVVGGPGRIEFKLFGVPAGANVVLQKVDEPRELRWHGGPPGAGEMASTRISAAVSLAGAELRAGAF